MAKEVVSKTEYAFDTNGGVENTTTITKVLSQALKSGDTHLLETALGITDSATIEASLQRLSIVQVPALLKELTTRITYKPNRLEHLLPWIRGCISVHGSSLTGNKDAKEAFESLELVLQRRASNHEMLLKLAGRLDLLMMQAVRKADQEEAVKMASLIHKPLAVYREDDDHSDMEVEAEASAESSNDEEMSVDEEQDESESDS